MHLQLEVDGTRCVVELTRTAEGATLGDVVEHATQVRLTRDVPVWVDTRRCAAGDRVHDLRLLEGNRIATAPYDRARPVTGWALSVSGGLEVGATATVPTGRPLLVGRSPSADLTLTSPSASWSHASVEVDGDGVRVRDNGSTNGTWVDGVRVDEEGTVVCDRAVVVLGGTTVTVWRGADESLAPAPGTLPNLTPVGTAPFNRPPRTGPPPEATAIEPPRRPSDPPPARFGLAAIVAPLLMAGAMVGLMHDLRYAAFALLSPVLAIGTAIEQKRRRTKDVRENDRAFATALETFRADLVQAAVAERTRRRGTAPDPARMLRRAALPSTDLWERRAAGRDFGTVHAGVATGAWQPPVDAAAVRRSDADVRAVVDEAVVSAAPVPIPLGDGGVVGVVGDRPGALAVARSLLCQAATHAGPADLTIGVLCDPGREEEWSWTSWLPHVRRFGDASGGRWLSADRPRSEALLRSLQDGLDAFPTPAVLLLIDSDVLTEGRDALARRLLGHGRRAGREPSSGTAETQVSGIVVAATAEALPAACTSVIHVGRDAHGEVDRPHEVTRVTDVVLAGVSVATARDWAADLARFDDPELSVAGARLPTLVRLPPLLGLDAVDAAAIRRSWAATAGTSGLSTPLGIGEDGVFGIDLVRDGPHGLVGGTTGSGKSEFLRSLVAGLAARNDPSRLTFVLIDFKGGAAFRACERLPHTIGTVSNLDERLAARAITALEAELRHRQEVFAAAGVDDLDAYLATRPTVAMPRLLLVVDEFAMLAKDHPDVLKSLVSVAAVGRTLGIHMILATQRPAGVVNEDILANTNLRVALRVQSRDDSAQVIDVPDASAIGRTQRGRAYVKLGQDEVFGLQTALVTGRAERPSGPAASALVELHPVRFGQDEERPPTVTDCGDEESDLDLLIDAIVEADAELGYAPPRRVWPEELGARVSLSAVGGVRGSVVQVALADEPRRQRQVPVGWDLDRGNLLLLGIPGSGTTTTLATLALTLAEAYGPDELDLLVLDLGVRELAPLADLPHTAAYVGAGSGTREQQVRFLRHLRAELERRRASPGPHRRTVVLIDGLGVLKDEFDDFDGLKLLEGLYRVIADGPDVGLWTAVTTSRAKAVPAAIEEVVTQRWLFRLADPYDYSAHGVAPRLAPAAVPGRCVVAETSLQAHVATPDAARGEAVAAIANRWAGSQRKLVVVGRLPAAVTVAELAVPARLTGEPWRLPVGVRESDLGPAELEVFEGEHVLVAGGARSGKSTLLLALAESVRATRVPVWAVCSRRSPLQQADVSRRAVGEAEASVLLAAARIHRGPLVVLVDDAERFGDGDDAFADLLALRTTDLLVVAAGRPDDLRSRYSHWTRTVGKSRCGVLLRPDVDLDGELLGVTLPRRAPVELTPGRGYLVSGGSIDLVQALSPSSGVVPASNG